MSITNQHLHTVQEAYFSLNDSLNQHNNKLSLEALLELDYEYAYGQYQPNTYQAEVEPKIKAFCQAYNIWHERVGDVYNTMTAYLHPITNSAEDLLIIGKFYSFLFFIDDYNGNDTQKFLTAEERAHSKKIMSRLDDYLRIIYLEGELPRDMLGETALEQIMASIIQDFYDHIMADGSLNAYGWFKEFIKHLREHLSEMVTDQDSAQLLTVNDYLNLRDLVSGMKPTLMLMQFARQNYLPYDLLGAYNLIETINQLELYTVRYASLVNDLFSFYKEVIEDKTIFNLVAIEYLNHIDAGTIIDLREVIESVSQRINIIRREFLSTEQELRAVLLTQRSLPQSLQEQILSYIEDLHFGMIASWRWEFEEGNLRYARQREFMIFEEIMLS